MPDMDTYIFYLKHSEWPEMTFGFELVEFYTQKTEKKSPKSMDFLFPCDFLEIFFRLSGIIPWECDLFKKT